MPGNAGLANTKISTKDIAVSAATWLRTVGNVELQGEVTPGFTGSLAGYCCVMHRFRRLALIININ